MTRRYLLALALVLLAACQAPPTLMPPSLAPSSATPAVAPTSEVSTPPATTATLGPPIYSDASQPVEARVDDLLARMTLAEKIGQMTQVEKGSITSDDITSLFIGALL